MKLYKYTLLTTALLYSLTGSLFGGSAFAASVESFYEDAVLVAVVEIKTVTEVTVPTGEYQTSNVYVAEADVVQTIKSDYSPIPEKRKIAIVGSTIPMSSAVWEPIKKQRYLAFLNREQGHYTYNWKYAMRPISPDGKVEWLEKNANGVFEISHLKIDEAIKRLRSKVEGAK